MASDYLGSRGTEDCANLRDRVHVHQPSAPEIADNASSFERHFEDDFSRTPSSLDEIVAIQRLALEALVLDTLVMTVNAVTVEAQATAKQLPDMDYNMELFVVAVDVEARASEALKTVSATIDEGTSAYCSETWEGKSGMMEREKYLFY